VTSSLSVCIQLKDEELGLDARHHLVARSAFGFRDLSLHACRVQAGERRAVGIVDVADDPGDLARGVTVGSTRSLQVGSQHHVRFFDPDKPSIDEPSNMMSPRALVELALGHLDVLVAPRMSVNWRP